MEKLPKRIEQVQKALEKGVEVGMVMHKHSVEDVPSQLAELIAAPIEDHPLIKPFTAEDKQVSDEDLEKLKTRAKDVLASVIIPAFKKLKQFLENVYFYKLRPSESILSLPDGEKMYQQCLNFHLSCEMTPEEVHELGLTEVERIYQRISELAIREGYSHYYDYVQHVKKKDKEQFDSAKDLLNHVNDLCYNKIQPKLPALVIPAPPILANAPTGFYYAGTPDGSRPGLYHINIHNLEAM
ncbi:hypothetical protein BaRGS_00039897 [Batillaria attramentaria]|uniref:Uncharacterized protein n=1 Tax=Batillaria attramentaria TaxID=370345 RepID=A0ABD0J2B0_9CAEN